MKNKSKLRKGKQKLDEIDLKFKKKDDEYQNNLHNQFESGKYKNKFINPDTQQYFALPKQKNFKNNESLIRKTLNEQDFYPNLSILKQKYENKNKTYNQFQKLKKIENVKNQKQLQSTQQFFNLTEAFQTKKLQQNHPYIVFQDPPKEEPKNQIQQQNQFYSQTHTVGYKKSKKQQIFNLPNFYGELTQKQFNEQIPKNQLNQQNQILQQQSSQQNDQQMKFKILQTFEKKSILQQESLFNTQQNIARNENLKIYSNNEFLKIQDLINKSKNTYDEQENGILNTQELIFSKIHENNSKDNLLDNQNNQFNQSLIQQQIYIEDSLENSIDQQRKNNKTFKPNLYSQQGDPILLLEDTQEQGGKKFNKTLLELIQTTFIAKDKPDDKYNIQKSQFIDNNVKGFISDIENNQQAFNFFAKYGNSTPIKYFFCTYRHTDVFRPYELKVIPYKEAMNLEYFFVISSFGIVYLQNKISYNENLVLSNMVPSTEWMQQQSQYNILIELSFFQYYYAGKIFISWKRQFYRQVFEKQRKKLKRNGVWGRKGFGSQLVKILSSIQEIKENVLISNQNKQLQKLWDFEEFIRQLSDNRKQKQEFYNDKILEMIQQLKEFQKKLYNKKQFEYLLGNMKYTYQQMKVQKDLIKLEVKQKSMNQVRKEKELYYTLLNENKQDKYLFCRFLKLIQYMINNALIYINYFSIETLLEQFQMVRKQGFFKLALIVQNRTYAYKPNQNDFTRIILYQIQEIYQTINNTLRIQQGIDIQDDVKVDLVKFIKQTYKQQQLIQKLKECIINDYELSYKHMEQLNKCIDIQNEYGDLQIKENYDEFTNKDYQIDESQYAIQISLKQQTQIDNLMKDSLKGIFQIQTQNQKQKLTTHINFKLNFYKKYMYKNMKILSQQLFDELAEFESYLQQMPVDLRSFKNYIQQSKIIKNKLITLDETRQKIETIHGIFKKFDANVITYMDHSQLVSIQTNIVEVRGLIEIGEKYVQDKKKDNIEKYNKTYNTLSNQIDKFITGLQSGAMVPNEPIEKIYQLLINIGDVKLELQEKQDKLSYIKEEVQVLIDYKQAIDEEFYEIENLEILDNKFNDRKLLWETIEKFTENVKEWTFSPIKDIDISQMEKKMESYDLINNQLKFRVKNLSDNGNDHQLNFYQQELAAFKDIYTLIPSLGNKDLRPQHYKQIFNLFGMEEPLKDFSFQDLLKQGAQQYKDTIEEISITASGEALIEFQLNNIINKWEELEFVVQPLVEQNMYKITQVDEIFIILDDHLLSIQSMLGTKYVVGIKDKVLEWNKKLQLINSNIDEWLLLQKNWMYLENIFCGQDIQKKLPNESQLFLVTDKFFRDLMNRTFKSPNIQSCIGNVEIHAIFKKNNKQLDQILKSLQNYLESVRLIFPRFYIISNDDLLQILSSTRKPSGIQVHLRKVFDNLNRLIFDDEMIQSQIVGIKSFDPVLMPEQINFIEPLELQNGENLETWLKRLEVQMTKELYYNSFKCLQQFEEQIENRINWLFGKFPAQSILQIEMIKWQEQVTQCIIDIKTNKNSLQEGFAHQGMIINNLVEIVKQDLNVLQTNLICTLLVIDVHLRDVIEYLNDNQVIDVLNFDWVKQLRYYWINKDCVIKQTNSSFDYSYEYLGNGPRLVMTPLTDTCYITLTTALNLCQGGMPNGPAGTGKTETVKDLAKALAIFCIVFNCSDSLDNKTITGYLKAICQCGSWVCYDEYNRLTIDVISYMTQQIIQIQTALKLQQNRFDFEEMVIPIDKRLGIFITLNPTYLNRTKLPESLKCLFRPMAMMVPDYELIGEILLLSSGFLNARILSKKICQILSYTSQQLSNQQHYDFGMRTLKQILIVANDLRRANPNEPEDKLILQSIYESNITKFIDDDCPLFISLLKDFFPSLQMPKSINKELIYSIQLNLKEKIYQSPEAYTSKIIQLYEIFKYRNGVMIIGQTGSGKTTLYETLNKSLKELNEVNSSFNLIVSQVINPKSLSIKQIYGYNNNVLNEWVDGVLPRFIRLCQQDQSLNQYRFVFDGPVDAQWIENLNTALDDNKMICLSNGERIKLPLKFGFLFEIDNLNQASPATISRCGMIYLDENTLGFKSIIQSWIQQFIKKQFKINIEDFKNISNPIASQILNFEPKLTDFFTRNQYAHKKDFDEIIPGNINIIVQSCLNILNLQLQHIKKVYKDINYLGTISQANQDNIFNIMIIFAIIWSYGTNLVEKENRKNRLKISQYIKSKILKIYISFPLEGEIFDYMVDFKTYKFVKWENKVPKYTYDNNIPYYDLFIPTSETVKIIHLIEQLQKNKQNVLLLGEQSTCKTNIVKQYFTTLDDSFKVSDINITQQVNVMNIHDLYQNRFKNTFQRKTSQIEQTNKKSIIFIDDINMAYHDQFGASPVIEIIREITDHLGQYDQKTLQFQHLSKSEIIAAGNLFEGQKFSQRFTRHFNMIWSPQLASKNLEYIYYNITIGYFESSPNRKEFLQTIQDIVSQTILIYEQIQRSFLPSPAKPHYCFNMRDIAKIFQGVLQMKAFHYTSIDTIIKVWMNELLRQFYDRLTCEQDYDVLNVWIQESFKKLRFKGSIKDVKSQIICDFMNKKKDYMRCEVDIEQNLIDSVTQYNMYNTKQMNIIFFEVIIRHLVNLSRIMRFNRQNALLIGLLGSGRNTLCKIVAFMRDLKVFEIDTTKVYKEQNWQEDIRLLIKQAGSKDIQTLFILNDQQIHYLSFIDNLSSLVNSQDIPNLLQMEDLDEIFQNLKSIIKDKTILESKTKTMEIFRKKLQDNLKIAIVLSPLGVKLRQIIRKSPQLLNYFTIDWYQQWPDEALIQITLKEISQHENLDFNNNQNKLAECCVQIHRTVVLKSALFLKEQDRQVYTTPSIFLDFIKTYIQILRNKSYSIPIQIQKYEKGIEIIHQANESVEILQKKILDYQPIQQTQFNENLIIKLELQEQSNIANTTKENLAESTKLVNEQQILIEEQKIVISQENEEAQIILSQCKETVNKIDKSQLMIIKSYTQPPNQIRLILSACCLLFGYEESWESGKKNCLSDMKFLEKLINFDVYQKESRFQKFRKKYLNMKEFDRDLVEKQSAACTQIYDWLKAIDKYQEVFVVSYAKEKQLNETINKLNEIKESFKDKTEKLAEITEKAYQLDRKYQESLKKENQISNQIELAKLQLGRAEKLIHGLSFEQVRWDKSQTILKDSLFNLIGDIMLSSAFIEYLGPFSQNYRQALIQEWLDLTKEQNLPLSKNFQFENVMSNDNQIQEWLNNDLPFDKQQIENAIIIFNSRKWPLIIDPTNQANNWIRNTYKQQNLQVTKLSNPRYLKIMESAIQFGQILLLENVEEKIDSILEPILLKQTTKKGLQNLIKLGENEINLNNDFRMFITSKLVNPHYLPELSNKVTVLNFNVSRNGLEEQLLSEVIRIDRPDLEIKLQELVKLILGQNQILVDLEDKILQKINESKHSLLDNDALINVIQESSATYNQVTEQIESTTKTKDEINTIREQYRPLAIRGVIIYFCLLDQIKINHMYQWSLDIFLYYYRNTIKNSEQFNTVDERILNLIKQITIAYSSKVKVGLFLQHQKLISFYVCSRILAESNQIDNKAWNFFIFGASMHKIEIHQEKPNWIKEKIWIEIAYFSQLDSSNLGSILSSIIQDQDMWQKIINSENPFQEEFPSAITLNNFQKLILVKILCADKLQISTNQFIEINNMSYLNEIDNDSLQKSYKDMTTTIPFIFILQSGMQSKQIIEKLAKQNKMDIETDVLKIRFSQDQLDNIEKLSLKAKLDGFWLVLEECHLAVSQFSKLDKIVNEHQGMILHKKYRLFITTECNDKFPSIILQNSIKYTIEPPQDLRFSIQNQYLRIPLDEKQTQDYKRLFFRIIIFHSLILQRQKYGYLGWNNPYEWMNTEVSSSINLLQNEINNKKNICYQFLKYVISQIIYGGKVTDDKDYKVVKSILNDVFEPQSFSLPSYDYEEVFKYIDELPLVESAEIYGLNKNASIIYQKDYINKLLDNIKIIQTKQQQDNTSNDELIKSISDQLQDSIQNKITVPKQKDIGPLINFRNQEIIKYNILIDELNLSFKQLRLLQSGEIIMTSHLENMINSFNENEIPKNWKDYSFETQMSLSQWIKEFNKRIVFMNQWAQQQELEKYDFSCFYFPSGFLTCVMQSYSRKNQLSIDQIYIKQDLQKEKQQDSIILYGLYIQGAIIDPITFILKDQTKKQIFYQMPDIQLIPQNINLQNKDLKVYECPVYQTSIRRGELSTNGHSTNFITYFDLKTEMDPDFWIRRGAAIILQNDD